MSATLTVYWIASPRSCAIAAGPTTTLRDQARHHVRVCMIVLLEQQTRGNHRHRHLANRADLSANGWEQLRDLGRDIRQCGSTHCMVADFKSLESARLKMVDLTGIEPVTS